MEWQLNYVSREDLPKVEKYTVELFSVVSLVDLINLHNLAFRYMQCIGLLFLFLFFAFSFNSLSNNMIFLEPLIGLEERDNVFF